MYTRLSFVPNIAVILISLRTKKKSGVQNSLLLFFKFSTLPGVKRKKKKKKRNKSSVRMSTNCPCSRWNQQMYPDAKQNLKMFGRITKSSNWFHFYYISSFQVPYFLNNENLIWNLTQLCQKDYSHKNNCCLLSTWKKFRDL